MRAIVHLALIAACGGSESLPPLIDAAQDPFLCLVPADYGDVGAKTGTTSLGPTTATIVLDMGPPRDSFFLRLASGKGAFAGGLQTGTFTIAGDELDSDTCGVCVNLLADIGNMGPQKFFFANAGTVTLTSHTPPAGTLSNVTMHEVTSGGTEIEGGCVTAIGAMTFTSQ